jgi:hypothetical protein
MQTIGYIAKLLPKNIQILPKNEMLGLCGHKASNIVPSNGSYGSSNNAAFEWKGLFIFPQKTVLFFFEQNKKKYGTTL